MAAVISVNIPGGVELIFGQSAKFVAKSRSREEDVIISLVEHEMQYGVVFSSIESNNSASFRKVIASSTPHVLIVERGMHSFIEKFDMAIKAGYKALIIANTDFKNPKSVIGMFGEIAATQNFAYGPLSKRFSINYSSLRNTPVPCLMIHYDDYRRLKSICPTIISIKPFGIDHLKKLCEYHFDIQLQLVLPSVLGIIIRSCCTFGHFNKIHSVINYMKTIPNGMTYVSKSLLENEV